MAEPAWAATKRPDGVMGRGSQAIKKTGWPFLAVALVGEGTCLPVCLAF